MMRLRCSTILFVILLWLASGCTPASPSPQVSQATVPLPDADNRAPAAPEDGLSLAEQNTLSSLEKVDDYPLYVMVYEGVYNQDRAQAGESGRPYIENTGLGGSQPGWGCSLFAALGDLDEMFYGRNFDWEYSPALLLYTDPPDGYASVSLVDIAYLFPEGLPDDLDSLPLDERLPLLRSPWLPFDGMNEHGLVIGMAAVPAGWVPPDPAKPTIDSLEIQRKVLDSARDVQEALGVFRSFNISMGGGPPLHYLVADRQGRAALVEFTDRLVVIENEAPWHLATNHLRALADPGSPSSCWRYDKIERQLSSTGGRLTSQNAVDLLEDVSQPGDYATQWSVVYGMNSGEVQVRMGRAYNHVLTFQLKMAGEMPAENQGGFP